MNKQSSGGDAPMILFAVIAIFPILLFVIFEKIQAPLYHGIGNF